MVWFWLDDERGVPVGADMIAVPDYDSMLRQIQVCVQYNIPFGIHFDHDIGDPYFSGYTIARYIVENEVPMAAFAVHSMNPVGAQNIRQLLTHYGYQEVR